VGLLLNEPDEQIVQLDACDALNEPREQLEHPVAFTNENCPAAQDWQGVELLGAKLPAEQNVQDAADPRLNEPVGQGMHEPRVLLARYVPARQGLQVDDGDTAEKPGLQALHELAPALLTKPVPHRVHGNVPSEKYPARHCVQAVTFATGL